MSCVFLQAHGVRESRDCERNQLCGSASIRSRPVRLITRASSEDYREQFVKQGRREWLLSSATLAGVAFPGSAHGLGRFFDVAEDSVSGTPEGANAGTSVRSSAKVQQSVDDVTTWFRFRGEGFALRIPPGYQDVLDPLNEVRQFLSHHFPLKLVWLPPCQFMIWDFCLSFWLEFADHMGFKL